MTAGVAMELIYTGRSTRKLTKRLLVALIREHGISEAEFEAWLDISVDMFSELNPRLRYETFKAQVEDYLQTGRVQPFKIRGVSRGNALRARISTPASLGHVQDYKRAYTDGSPQKISDTPPILLQTPSRLQ